MKNAHLKIYLNILPNRVKIDNYAFFPMLFNNKQQNSKKNRILILFRKNVSYQIFGNRTNFWDRDPWKKNFPPFPFNLIIINLNVIIFSRIKLKFFFRVKVSLLFTQPNRKLKLFQQVFGENFYPRKKIVYKIGKYQHIFSRFEF